MVAGNGLGVAAAAACALCWLVVLAFALPGATACLAASLALEVWGVMAGGPGWLAAASAGASLAAWEFTSSAIEGTRSGEEADRPFLRHRSIALGAGLLPGLALAGLLGRVHAGIPFAVMAGLAGVALLALDRLARRWR